MEWLGWTIPSSFCLSGSLISFTGIWRVLCLGLGLSLAAGPCGEGAPSERAGEMGGTNYSTYFSHGHARETDGGGVSGAAGRELGKS